MNFHISALVREEGKYYGQSCEKGEIAEITRLRLPDRNVPALGLRSATHASKRLKLNVLRRWRKKSKKCLSM